MLASSFYNSTLFHKHCVGSAPPPPFSVLSLSARTKVLGADVAVCICTQKMDCKITVFLPVYTVKNLGNLFSILKLAKSYVHWTVLYILSMEIENHIEADKFEIWNLNSVIQAGCYAGYNKFMSTGYSYHSKHF